MYGDKMKDGSLVPVASEMTVTPAPCAIKNAKLKLEKGSLILQTKFLKGVSDLLECANGTHVMLTFVVLLDIGPETD